MVLVAFVVSGRFRIFKMGVGSYKHIVPLIFRNGTLLRIGTEIYYFKIPEYTILRAKPSEMVFTSMIFMTIFFRFCPIILISTPCFC